MGIITIGRHPDNDIVINDPTVGRHHLQIMQHDDGHFSVLDLNSKNGTYVNGKRVYGEVRLSPNDEIQIGRTILPWRNYFASSTHSSRKKRKKVSSLLFIVCCAICGVVFIIVMLFSGRSNETDSNNINTQVLISFREDISHYDACCWLNEHSVKILDVDEQFNYYLVGARSENAAEALVSQCEIPIIDCAVRNAYHYPCALVMYAIDNFDSSHGNMVKETMGAGNGKIRVSAHNVNAEGGISSDKITSEFIEICNQMNDTNMNIINISLGISEYKDNSKTVLKTKEEFHRDYANSLRWYANLADKCGNKNFVITKAMGNEHMHSIDEAFKLSMKKMNDSQRKALMEHMVFVAAKDTRKWFYDPDEDPLGYSNTLQNKVDGVNTIMVDVSHLSYEQNGTSAAAPLVANWIAKSGFTNASDAIEAINESTQSDELVSSETFQQTAQKIVNQRNMSYNTINEPFPNSKFTIEGILKMYVYDPDNNRWKIKVATNDLDQIDDYVAFVVELDHYIDVFPYLENSEQDMLDDRMHNAIMIVFDGSKRKLASRYAYKRVRVSGDIYVPMAGWRNKTSVVMNLNSIARTEDMSVPKITTTALASTTSVGNNIPNSIEKDLVGQTIYEPSSNGYFPKDWRWTLKEGEVLNVSVLECKQYSNVLNLNVLAHLHRGKVNVDAEIEMRYGKANGLQSITVKKIIIPSQTDYSQYAKLKMDYDFFPTLRLYNNSDMTLFIGGDYSSGTEYKKFSGVVEPHSSKPVAMGSIDSYHIHFAYEK